MATGPLCCKYGDLTRCYRLHLNICDSTNAPFKRLWPDCATDTPSRVATSRVIGPFNLRLDNNRRQVDCAAHRDIALPHSALHSRFRNHLARNPCITLDRDTELLSDMFYLFSREAGSSLACAMMLSMLRSSTVDFVEIYIGTDE